MNIIPINDQILIEMIEFEEKIKTDGGIILVDAEQRPPMPIVRAIGPNASMDTLNQGDAVYIRPMAGFELKDNKTKKKFRLVGPKDILAIIEDYE